jgi:hypothetical protein
MAALAERPTCMLCGKPATWLYDAETVEGVRLCEAHAERVRTADPRAALRPIEGTVGR